MFTSQQRMMILEAQTKALEELKEEKIKQLNARKLVPFMKKGDDWASFLKYWASKGSTELTQKSKNDTEGNSVAIQLKSYADEILRYPIDIDLPLVVFNEIQNNKRKIIDYFKAMYKEAMRATNIYTDELCITGKGIFSGLINDKDIDTYSFSNTVENTTGKVFLEEIEAWMQSMVLNSYGAFKPNQLAVSSATYKKLTSTRIGATEQTLYDKLCNENIHLKNSTKKENERIIYLPELDTVAGAGKQRQICLADDEAGNNFYFEETMNMVQITKDFGPKRYIESYENRSGGLMIDHLKSLSYADIREK